MGGFSETTEQMWKCRTRQTYQDLELLLVGQRQTAVEEDRPHAPISHEGISLAGSEAVTRRFGEPSQNHQRSADSEHSNRTLQSGEDAETQ